MKRSTFLKRKTKILRRDNRLAVDCLRVYFLKSNKHYYASLIENNTGNVIALLSTQMVSSFEKSSRDRVTDLAQSFAEKIMSMGFTSFDNITFDRGVYRFHGLVKHFVEQIRIKGIEV